MDEQAERITRQMEALVRQVEAIEPLKVHAKGGRPYSQSCTVRVLYWLLQDMRGKPIPWREVARKLPGVHHTTLLRRYRLWKEQGVVMQVRQLILEHLFTE